ncbi:hypothetical protein AHMF7605_18150 [Adhaeribacter arboris]|uniref:Uncharacterized protein n=1 Tax=Adhaeribacter arboris TaxID=2072846 RepID=A0A2T2YID6_9BACT|nr:hypothetical protein [Adhaeribacter arboris]PSR55288.1 hypothetical protein AHMF7605_18150 [Adhaeribacter arboris]
MKDKLLFIYVIFVLDIPVLSAQPNVEKLKIYKHFFKGGSTMRLVNAFKYPASHAGIVDTTNINLNSLIPIQDWNDILYSAKKSKHHQMKIGGIVFAGEMKMANKVHYFIVARPDLIVDLTDRMNYRMDNKSKNLLGNSITRWMDLRN